MAQIEGLKKVIAAMRAKAAKMKQDADVSVAVGYTSKYALYVHENVEMKWRGLTRRSGIGVYWGPTGEAKFLEGPFRREATKYASIVRNAIMGGKTMAQALLMAGLQLQRDSQMLVPVEYGFLRASAFTRLETPAVRGGGGE